MNVKQIIQTLKEMVVGEEQAIDDMTYAVRTSKDKFSICDNGEEVSNLTIEQAAKVAKENLS